MSNRPSLLFRLFCAGLALLLLAGCAGGGETASSGASSGGAVSADNSGDVSSGEDETQEGASSRGAGVIADIPQKEADPVAVEETKAGRQSSFNVSKTGILQAYPEYDERIERDYTYTVTVTQGSNVRSLTCYNHCDAVASAASASSPSRAAPCGWTSPSSRTSSPTPLCPPPRGSRASGTTT